MFWNWLLKYSSLLLTGTASILVGYILHWLITEKPDLISYASQPQWVPPPAPAQPGAGPLQPIGTFTLFLFNQGRAPAKDVHVGHYFLPAHNVFPDIPREQITTPGGGTAIRFSVLPPRVLISISYLFFGVFGVSQIVSYVGSEAGAAKHVPVVLQRVWPNWMTRTAWVLLVAGAWVAVNAVVSLIRFLFVVYFK